jgi:hypothetical protein
VRPPQVPERRARSNDDAGWVLLPRTGGPYIDEGCLTVLHNRGHADADHSQHDRYDNRLPAWTARRPVVVCYARQLMVSVDLRLAVALVQRGTISRRSQLPPNRPRESAQPHGQKIEPNPTLRHIPLRRYRRGTRRRARPRSGSCGDSPGTSRPSNGRVGLCTPPGRTQRVSTDRHARLNPTGVRHLPYSSRARQTGPLDRLGHDSLGQPQRRGSRDRIWEAEFLTWIDSHSCDASAASKSGTRQGGQPPYERRYTNAEH